MRTSLRVGLVVVAFAVLAVGVWFALRDPTLPRRVTYSTIPGPDERVYDQLPVRIGVAMASSAVATGLILIAARRR